MLKTITGKHLQKITVLSLKAIVSFRFNITTLLGNSADNKLIVFVLFCFFSQKIRLDISCELSPKETTCMKCQMQFSGKNRKIVSRCHLLNFFPSMLCVKYTCTCKYINCVVLNQMKYYSLTHITFKEPVMSLAYDILIFYFYIVLFFLRK